jgi:hypothetical protein
MSMKPEPQAGRVSRAAHSKLRLGVDLSNAPHVRASLAAREVIAQNTSSRFYGAGRDARVATTPIGDRDVR